MVFIIIPPISTGAFLYHLPSIVPYRTRDFILSETPDGMIDLQMSGHKQTSVS
jgi:hypothetical protein